MIIFDVDRIKRILFMPKEIQKYESLEDALMFCIRASNKEIKVVASALWPSDSPQTSYQRLIDAINPSKRQKLSMNEIIFIMHFCNRYDPLYYMTDQCIHERPVKKCLETEKRNIEEQFQALMAQSTKAYQHIVDLTKRAEEVEEIRNGKLTYFDIERKVG